MLYAEEDRVEIGSFCSIALNVTILAGGEHNVHWATTYPLRIAFGHPRAGQDGQPKTKGKITIGNDVWIGDGATILSGVTIGDGAVIGAGAVVVKDIAPYAIVAGNPARLIRFRFSAETIAKLLVIAWWNWPIEKIEANTSMLCGEDVSDFIADQGEADAQFNLGLEPVNNSVVTNLANARPTGEIKIFQVFYDDKTRLLLDPDFIPLDNTENARPDWCEYWSIRKVLLNQTFDDDAYLGFFSPRFFDKTSMTGREVLEIVQHSSEEVISFSPYFDQSALNQSPFFQGEAHHRGLISATQDILALLNVSINLGTLVCDQTTTIFFNYFVARYSFWKKWLAYAEKIFALCEGPDNELKNRLVDSTSHNFSHDYAMKVFVMERLVTIVMEEQHLRAKVCINIHRAPLSLVPSRAILDKLIVCDALKTLFLETGLLPFMDVWRLYLKQLVEIHYAQQQVPTI